MSSFHRLSGFYLFYFASLGAFMPYWGLYLQGLNYDARQIGELMAIVAVTKVVSPNVWGWIADHTGKRMAIVRLGCLLAVLAFAGVFFVQGFWWLAFVMLIYSFFWNAALPQFEATTMARLGDQAHRYSRIRLWGSVGFIFTAALMGPLLQSHGTALLPWVVASLIVAIWLISMTIPEQAAGHLPLDHEPLRRVLLRPQVLALLLACFLVQFSHGPYYTFYSIYLEKFGYSRTLIGQLWALGVVAEVVVFMFMHRLVPRFGLRRLFLWALALTAIRWLLIAGFVEQLALLALTQLFHAASFGVFHAVAIQLIHQQFTGRHQGKGQALYSSLSWGLGGALGSLMAGYTWSALGAQWSFVMAAFAALLGLGVAWLRIHPPVNIQRIT